MNMHDDTAQSPSIYCSQCGYQVPNKRFCMFCGEPLMKSGLTTQNRLDLTVEQTRGSRQPITELPEGTKIGDYTISSRMGSGGFGIVYAAYHQYSDDRIALKLIPVTSQSMVNAIKNEFSVRRKITDFSHVVRAWQPSTVTYQGTSFLAYPMELMASDLSPMISRAASERSVEWIQTVTTDLFPQICAGVAQCHRHGILHLDIKPSNVLLDSHGVPKMTDFGISAIARGPASSPSAGALWYAAPEQLQGGQVDERTDVYALGVLLLELTTGSRDSSAYESLSADHPDLGDVIDRCTRHIPSKRFQSIEELRTAIESDNPYVEPRSTKTLSVDIRVYAPFNKLNTRQQQKGLLSSFSRRSVEEWITITGCDVRHYYKVPRIKKLTDLFGRGGEHTVIREIESGEIIAPGITIQPHRRVSFLVVMILLAMLTLGSGAHVFSQVDSGSFDLFSWYSLRAIYAVALGFIFLLLIPSVEARENKRFALNLARVEVATASGTIGPVLVERQDAAKITRLFARGQ